MKQIAKAFIVGTLITAIGGVYYYHSVPQSPISDYQEARDKKDILNLFESDWYWLTASEDYDPAFMLDTRSPNKYDKRYYGKLHIKVLRENNEFIGFVAYYKKTFYEGLLLFVSINPKLRGKRYAERLMDYAEKDLKSMGVGMVRLVTRTTNHRAQALYKRIGYTEVSIDEDGGFVYFARMI